MSINKLVLDTLQPLGVPVVQHHYGGSASTHITFFEFNQRAQTSADNEEIETRYSIQVDVVSTGDLEVLVNQVKSAMIAEGFIRKSETSMYNSTTKKYRKSISFQITL